MAVRVMRGIQLDNEHVRVCLISEDSAMYSTIVHTRRHTHTHKLETDK